MLSTAVLHEWGGDIKWISYSIPLLILLFGVATVVDMCSNMNVKFDEVRVFANIVLILLLPHPVPDSYFCSPYASSAHVPYR